MPPANAVPKGTITGEPVRGNDHEVVEDPAIGTPVPEESDTDKPGLSSLEKLDSDPQAGLRGSLTRPVSDGGMPTSDKVSDNHRRRRELTQILGDASPQIGQAKPVE